MRFLMGTGHSKSYSHGKKATAARNGKQKDSVSKDESFFDSRAYLDSDDEEDYYSVKGEPTSSSDGTPKQVDEALQTNGISDGKSQPFPKKNLAQLLEDILKESDEEQTVDGKAVHRKSRMAIKKTPQFQGAKSTSTSEETPMEDGNYEKVKTRKKRSCCLPPMHC